MPEQALSVEQAQRVEQALWLKKRWAEKYENKPGYQITKIATDAVKPREEGKIRIVCISDTHSSVENVEPPFNVPDGDILIHAGDFTDYGEVQKVKEFNQWLGTLPHKHKIVVAGNHDTSFDPSVVAPGKRFWEKLQHPELHEVKPLMTNCIYLEDSHVTIEGYKIYGTPWQPLFGRGDRAFQILHSDVEKWEEVCAKIPPDTDILVSHSPPLGIQDGNGEGRKCGSEVLLRHVVERVKPKYHIFGHIHESYGVATNGLTTFANAASCTHGSPRVAENPPIVFDVDRI